MATRRLLLLALCMLAATLWPQAAPAGESSTAVTKTVSHVSTASGETSRNVSLNVAQNAQVAGSAQADSELYEGLEDNEIVESGGESIARIADGFAGALGIVSINQSPGNNNNQGNVVSFAYVEADGDSIITARGAAQVLNTDNVLEATDMVRTNIIEDGAFRDFTGALQINQSAGSLNNQNNILAVGAGARSVIALSEGALGQQVARNTIYETGVLKQDIITAQAFSHVSGIVSINQSSGCGNNQTNMIIITVQQFH